MKRIQNILCATDFSEHCRVAAERATELAKFYDARLTILHVVELFPVNRSNETISPEDIDPKYYREQQAKKCLEELAKSLDHDKVVLELRFSSHAAKHEIVSFAEEQNTDLIVVASHGRHRLTSILGSTSYALAHTAPCDVMIISAHKIS